MSRIIPLLAWGMAAVMLGHSEPLPAQDSSQAKTRAYQRQMEIEAALQERLARRFSEEMPQRMAEMEARLQLELAPRLEELQMRLPEMLEEIDPPFVLGELPEIDAALAGLHHLPLDFEIELPDLPDPPDLAGLAELPEPPLPESLAWLEESELRAAPFSPHAAHSRYRRYLSADELVQAQALQSLLRRDEQQALPELKKMMSHSNWAMRAVAVSLYGQVDAPEAVPALRQVLAAENDQRVRREAVRALGRRSEPEAAAALRELWKK
ncbi:MAG: hypothetical protein DKINENOH_02618 [bacterium]|nr:hypothetical protein [bacterium]